MAIEGAEYVRSLTFGRAPKVEYVADDREAWDALEPLEGSAYDLVFFDLLVSIVQSYVHVDIAGSYLIRFKSSTVVLRYVCLERSGSTGHNAPPLVPRFPFRDRRVADAPPFLCDCRKGLGNIGEMRQEMYDDRETGSSVWEAACNALL